MKVKPNLRAGCTSVRKNTTEVSTGWLNPISAGCVYQMYKLYEFTMPLTAKARPDLQHLVDNCPSKHHRRPCFVLLQLQFRLL